MTADMQHVPTDVWVAIGSKLICLDELRTVRNVAQDICCLRILAGSTLHEAACWRQLLAVCDASHRRKAAELLGLKHEAAPPPARQLPRNNAKVAAARLGLDAGGKLFDLQLRVEPYIEAANTKKVPLGVLRQVMADGDGVICSTSAMRMYSLTENELAQLPYVDCTNRAGTKRGGWEQLPGKPCNRQAVIDAARRQFGTAAALRQHQDEKRRQEDEVRRAAAAAAEAEIAAHEAEAAAHQALEERRRRALKVALERKGLKLREDSHLCMNYIYFGEKSVKEVVNCMLGMEWLYRNTGYRYRLHQVYNRVKLQDRKNGHTGDSYITDTGRIISVSEQAKREVLRDWCEARPDPAAWLEVPKYLRECMPPRQQRWLQRQAEKQALAAEQREHEDMDAA